MITRSLKAGFVLAFAIGLAGCGGGSGSSASAPSGNTIAAATVTGVAAKGIIKSAIVTAYELDTTGNVVRTVGTSTTDATGNYSLTTSSSYTGGPLKLVLTTNSSTKMVCDVASGCGTRVAFGQDYPLSPTFTLGAYQQGTSAGGTVTTQITPYTNMVVARVEAQVKAGTPLNNALVAGAISQVDQIVGVDISTVAPIDITNASAVAAASPDSLQYSAFNAGIGDLAFASGVFDTNVANVASSFADGKLDSTDPVSIGEITNAVSTEAQATPALNTTMLTATLASIAANTDPTTGTFSPTAPPAATLTAVAQAKALVSQTRTWGTQIAALKTPATAFGLDIDTARGVLNSNSTDLVAVFGKVLGQALKTVKTEAVTNGLLAQTYTYPFYYINSSGVLTSGTGSVAVVNSNGFLTLNISATNAGVTSSGTVTTTIPSSILGTPTTSLNLVALNTMTVNGSASMTSPAASISITNATLNVGLTTTGNSATLAQSDISSIDFNGGLGLQANSVTFTGTGKISMIANSVSTVNPISLSDIALSGTFSGANGSANASAEIKFNNAATFDTIGLLSYKPVIWANNMLPGDTFGMANAFASATGDTLQGANYDQYSNQTCSWGLTTSQCVPGDIYGLVLQVDHLINATYTTPAPTSIQNVYAGYYLGTTYYGAMVTFPDFESASKFANATLTVSSSVTLPGSPAATLTITANRTAYSSTTTYMGDAVAILSFNGQSVNISASNTGTAAGTLTITNPTGVKLVLNGTAGSTGHFSSGALTVGGTSVGSIDTTGAVMMIHYSDGTFESLN